jgi:hypothetical protein
MAFIRWLTSRLPSFAATRRQLRMLAPAGRVIRRFADWVFTTLCDVASIGLELLRQIRPGPLFGIIGLGLLFGGLAYYCMPVACVVTGLLIFLDARTPPSSPPPAPATR